MICRSIKSRNKVGLRVKKKLKRNWVYSLIRIGVIEILKCRVLLMIYCKCIEIYRWYYLLLEDYIVCGMKVENECVIKDWLWIYV